MKFFTPLVGAAALSAALGALPVQAADISNGPQALAILDNSAHFGDSFAMNNLGNTFSDQFRFSVTGISMNLDAIVASISRSAADGMEITGLQLYEQGGGLIGSGTMLHNGVEDVWTLTANNLAVGSYYVQVNGSMLSNEGASFGGAVMLNPVPEPGVYGLMGAGLGLLALMARRRQRKLDG
jgi:hypothetical protein